MGSVISEKIRIDGMYCTGCESRLTARLLRIDGVTKAKISYKDGLGEITYDSDKASMESIFDAIRKLDYEPAKISDNSNGSSAQSVQILSVLIIIIALYIIAKRLGFTAIFNVFPRIDGGGGMVAYPLLFVTGLLTSVHCIAMCGGINLSQSAYAAANDKGDVIQGKALSVTASNLLYNLGRIISYTLVGGIVGGIGAVISFGGHFREVVAAVAGILMIIAALNMLGLFKGLRRIRLHLPKGLYAAASKLFSKRLSFTIGLLNGLMPCGPLQSMQLYALSTGGVVTGALSMLVFSIGTVPLMLIFGLLSGGLNKRYKRLMLTVSAFVIFAMGISMLSSGMSLSGLSARTFAAEMLKSNGKAQNISVIKDGVQYVSSSVDYGAYEPITVTAGIPVVWEINVPKGKINGCNGEIIVPEYELDIVLSEGKNMVEFTPEGSGVIPYSCWMGMINSSITVNENRK